MAPRLRLHRLKGKHTVSLTYSHRIVLILRIGVACQDEDHEQNRS